jgi:hypothetical protein
VGKQQHLLSLLLVDSGKSPSMALLLQQGQWSQMQQQDQAYGQYFPPQNNFSPQNNFMPQHQMQQQNNFMPQQMQHQNNFMPQTNLKIMGSSWMLLYS